MKRSNQGDPLVHPVLAAELVDSPAGIDDLLLARVKRMTGRAHLDQKVFAERRTRREFVAATTSDLYIAVVRMNVGFHGLLSGALESAKKGA